MPLRKNKSNCSENTNFQYFTESYFLKSPKITKIRFDKYKYELFEATLELRYALPLHVYMRRKNATRNLS